MQYNLVYNILSEIKKSTYSGTKVSQLSYNIKNVLNIKKFIILNWNQYERKRIDLLKIDSHFIIIQDLYDLGFVMDHLKGNQK